jgi:hypothetical protein
MPEPNELKKVRQEIDYNFTGFKKDKLVLRNSDLFMETWTEVLNFYSAVYPKDMNRVIPLLII